jgi:hypothetical protein
MQITENMVLGKNLTDRLLFLDRSPEIKGTRRADRAVEPGPARVFLDIVFIKLAANKTFFGGKRTYK